MKRSGFISGTVPTEGKSFIKLERKNIKTRFGEAIVYLSDEIAFIPRHGTDPNNYILPHMINHAANLEALKNLSIQEIVGINSTGSLKKALTPGTIIIPDDFIILQGGPSIFTNIQMHVTPSLNEDIRQKLIATADDCEINVLSEGIYWQTRGPRLETKAEIRLIAQFADIVGMTMASEAIIACELGIPYASICSADNYAHGIVDKPLTIEEIKEDARKNAGDIMKIINSYIDHNSTFGIRFH